jgi:hypothetical protein
VQKIKKFKKLGIIMKYAMEDGKIFNTETTKNSWGEQEIGTGIFEKLWLSSKGNFALEFISHWQGEKDYARWISKATALRWIVKHGYTVPELLKDLLSELEE